MIVFKTDFKKLYLVWLFIISSFVTVDAQSTSKSLNVTNIANEGFLLSTTNNSILIDALFSDGYGFFAAPSKEVIDNIVNRKSPFDKVNSLFLTHYHKDHCDAQLVYEYLRNNKNIPLITSHPSIVFINGCVFDFILLKKQFIEMTPEINQSISTTVNNIPVKALGLKHLSYYKDGIDMEELMYNVSFIFELDGIKIFHSGDIMKNAFEDFISQNKKWTDNVDVAFLYYELLANGESDLEYIISILNPKHIVLMHIPPSMLDEWSAKIETLKSKFGNLHFYKSSMDSETIYIN